MNSFKKLLSVVCAIALFLGMFLVVNQILMRKTSIYKYQQFFEDELKYDVLLWGSSHMHNGISPLDLFYKQGITSYNMGSPGNYIVSAYYQMEYVADHFKDKLPKVIVLDVYDYKEELVGQGHNGWDYFKLGFYKWKMTKILYSHKNRYELLFPFSVYHNRWIEALKDLDKTSDVWFGASQRYKVSRPDKNVIRDKNIKEPCDPRDLEYLDKIIEFCERHKIKLILINLPYTFHQHNQRQANALYEFAEQRHITYINYLNESITLNPEIDFDDTSHLNLVGMRIMTDELGKLLRKTTDLHDYRLDPIAKRWKKEYQDYINYKINRLKGLKNTKEFLMACNDPDLTVNIEVNNKILTDKIKWLLVERLEKIDSNTIKKSSDKVTHTKADKKTQKCDISAVVFRRDSKKEIFRAAFSSSEKLK